jgi:CHAD domain-containing protein/CYTH domain-containing protein
MAGMRIEDRVMDLSVEEGARVVALGLLDEAAEAAGALASGSGEEPLHDFRVAVRRLRSALRTFRPWLEGGVRRKDEKRLRKLGRSTNEARDAEVQLAWLTAKAGDLAAPAEHAGHALAVARFEGRIHGGPDAARVAARFGRAGEKLRRRLERYERRVATGDDEGASFGAALASLVEEQAEALAGRMAAIEGAADQEGVHRARIEGKRLRYLLEPLRGYRPADAADVVAQLKKLQDLLGELHDAHVLAAELGLALAEVAAERARALHAAALAPAGGRVRAHLGASPRTGLLALVRLVRARRDALFAEVEATWREGGRMDALAAEARAVATALEVRAGGRIEHERKFLLSALPPRAAEAEAVDIDQGWLPGARLRERVRRVRRGVTERFFRAVKRGGGAARVEAEEETTRELFEALWPLTEGRRISKQRHKVREGSLVWEVDRFTDRELVLAEVELPARGGDFPLPEWLQPVLVREVTGDPAYLNENLATAPAPAAPAVDVETSPGGEAPPAGRAHP